MNIQTEINRVRACRDSLVYANSQNAVIGWMVEADELLRRYERLLKGQLDMGEQCSGKISFHVT